MQDQGEIIELHHLMEPAGQLMEQRRQIAVRDDRFRNGQQGSVAVAGGSCLSVHVSGVMAKTLVGQRSRTIAMLPDADGKVDGTTDILSSTERGVGSA